jgi:hypothetical protein
VAVRGGTARSRRRGSSLTATTASAAAASASPRPRPPPTCARRHHGPAAGASSACTAPARGPPALRSHRRTRRTPDLPPCPAACAPPLEPSALRADSTASEVASRYTHRSSGNHLPSSFGRAGGEGRRASARKPCCGFRRRRPPIPTEGDHPSERGSERRLVVGTTGTWAACCARCGACVARGAGSATWGRRASLILPTLPAGQSVPRSAAGESTRPRWKPG